MRIKHNDLTHYLLRPHEELPRAYLTSCEKFFRELGKKRNKFKKWLEQCPVEYDEIQETGDEDILTINFHGKDIYWHTMLCTDGSGIIGKE